MTNKQIEDLESKYLSKFYHFLKSFEEEMMDGFHTKEKIKNDWYGKYGANISVNTIRTLNSSKYF